MTCTEFHSKRGTLAATASPLAVPLNWLAAQWRGEAGGRVAADVTCTGPSRHLSTRWTPNWRCRRHASSPATTNSRTASVASDPTTAPMLSSVSVRRLLSTEDGLRAVWRSSSLCGSTVNEQVNTWGPSTHNVFGATCHPQCVSKTQCTASIGCSCGH